MRRLISSTLCKLLQRQTYTCLSSKYGIWMLIGGLLLTLISAFQFGEVVLEWSMQKYAITFNAYHDNIAEKSFQNRLCLPMPIDVVYTWVNGSDPRLLSQLEKLKTELEIEQNKTKLLELKNSRAGNLTEAEQGRNALEKALKHKKKTKATGKIKRVSQMSSTECPFANCIPALSIAIEDGLPASFTLSQVRELGPSFKSAKKVYNITLVGSVKERVTVVQFSEEQQVANALQEKVKWNGRRFRTVQAFYTSDLTKNTGVEARTEIMITFIKSKEEIDKTKQLLRRRLGNKLLEIKYHRKKKVAVAYFSDKKTVESILKPSKNITLEGDVKMNPVRIIWTLFSVNKNDDDEYSESELSASRFADNEELRYSLRSVEKHAPWVRKIFIVTNGQIPSWINLDNPRIRIVTHHEIFPNTSHLPTFSSPAIESHIHQIPGLSQKFIYMNDDVMFGDDVWPDDFYTHSKGQKIYLTWPVPNCNEGCPSSWINDKYCDKACNTSECDWDGGDCLNVKPKSRWGYGSWHGQQSSFKLQFCNTGCADTWVGDRYCDAACNVAKCGFDAGDCGVTQFSQLHSVVVTMAMKDVKVPCGVEAMYFNLTNIFGNGKISEGDYSSSSVLRSATIAQRHKTLTLTFRENQTASFLLYVKGFAGRNESNPVEVKFNVSIVKEIHVNSALKNSATTEDTLHYIRTQNSTDYSGPTSRIQTTLYPIRIHSDPLNYWNSGNISYPIPTWQSLHFDKDYYYYEALKVNNETALPQEIKSTLELIEKEFKDGDLTLKGYKRRKTKLLQDFFKTSNHSSPTVSPLAHLKMLTINGVPHAQTTPGTGMSLDPHFQGIKKINKNMDNKGTTAEKKAVDKDLHSRHLLSLVNWSDDYDKDPEMFSTIKKDEQNAAPDEDAKYVADWIADTKKKLLNYDKDIKEGRRDWEDRYGDWRPEIHPGETSFLPWERTGEFLEYQESEKRRAKVAKYETSPLHSRKLMDTFADSLLHVHRIYNRKFGYTARKVPAHMPHMIDLKVMNELQTILPHEFDQTSSHRLRSPDDMQFAFSFMYFVIGQKKELNITQVLSEVDTDHSGTLSDRELRILATRIFPLPLSLDTLKAFERMLINCSLNQSYSKNHPSVFPTEKYYISDMPLITKDFLASCDPVIALLNDSIKTLTKYKYETLGDEDVAFKMIRDNATAVMLQLDNIRGKRKKFVCLNDNIDHGTKEADVIKALLVDFYETLFPIPSQFELGHNYKNRFLYVDDLNDYLKERALVQKWTNIFMAVCVVIVVVFMFSNKILSILKKLCPFGRRFGPGSARLMTV